jgi:ribonuclease HI
LKGKKLYIYTDGASRGNPGPSGIGVVILDEKRKKLRELYRYIGEATNNVAEYNALICALEEAVVIGAAQVVIYMDSELMAKQLEGEYKVKAPEIKPLFEKALGMLKTMASFEIKHIERARNKGADKLANKAINLASLF